MICSIHLKILGRLTAYCKCLYDTKLLGYNSNQRRKEYKSTKALAKREARKNVENLKKINLAILRCCRSTHVYKACKINKRSLQNKQRRTEIKPQDAVTGNNTISTTGERMGTKNDRLKMAYAKYGPSSIVKLERAGSSESFRPVNKTTRRHS